MSVDLDAATMYAKILRGSGEGGNPFVRSPRSHGALVPINPVALINIADQVDALVAELRALRKANDGLYRQAMAKELRAARLVVEAAREICHDDWEDQKRLADAVAAYDNATRGANDA